MEGLGINFKLILAQVINFAIFYFIFRKFIAKPFMNFIKEGKKKDQEREKILASLKSKEEKAIDEEKKHRLKMKKEMEQALREVEIEAAKLREELVNKARIEAADLKSKTQSQIENERNQMEKEMRSKIVNLSIMVVNTALKNYLTEDAKKQLTEQILKNSSIKELNA